MQKACPKQKPQPGQSRNAATSIFAIITDFVLHYLTFFQKSWDKAIFAMLTRLYARVSLSHYESGTLVGQKSVEQGNEKVVLGAGIEPARP